MYRFRFLLLLALMLGSCATPRIFSPAPAPVPAIVRIDSFGQLTAGKVKFNGPVTVQVGQGNVASATKTNNAGRSASSGANGGQSSDVRQGGTPFWVWALLLAALFAAGFASANKILTNRWLPSIRVGLLALILLLPLASPAESPGPPRYSYKEARRVERRYNRVRRYYRRLNRRNTAELLRRQRQQARGLKRGHP